MLTKRFSAADQERFAALSGDWNPIHMDPIFARRTIAGKPVVHGIHLLMWALESVAEAGFAPHGIASLRARFSGFVGLEQDVAIHMARQDDDGAVLRLVIDGREKTEISIAFGLASAGESLAVRREEFSPGRQPTACTYDGPDGPDGLIRSAAPRKVWESLFPRAAQWIGGERLAALGASTRLVGMVCPGLHSVYLGLAVKFVDIAPDDEPLSFSMGQARHGLMRAKVAGSGIEGTLECLQRAAPHQQPRSGELIGLIAHDTFAGAHALVVGGSRGLGEICAKLLASGGAAVTITYAESEKEAFRVADDIRTISGRCDVRQYRVGDDCEVLMSGLKAPPSHGYYFATPQIAQPDSQFFDVARYANMQSFYVEGFWSFAASIHARQPSCRLFYPSTTYVSERPAGYGEYAMAKMAGELLCEEINRALAPMKVFVERLPQLTTDQTLTSFGVRGEDPVKTLLPIIRWVQGQP